MLIFSYSMWLQLYIWSNYKQSKLNYEHIESNLKIHVEPQMSQINWVYSKEAAMQVEKNEAKLCRGHVTEITFREGAGKDKVDTYGDKLYRLFCRG